MDNDGIDSNGSIKITNGIVVSVNQYKPNESFDSDEGRLCLLGGTVFGIGSGPVNITESIYPCYTTPFDLEGSIRSKGLIITDGKYICVQKGQESLIALRNGNKAFRTFITVMSPSFVEGERLTICESEPLVGAKFCLFSDVLMIGGTPVNPFPIIEVQTNRINNQ